MSESTLQDAATSILSVLSEDPGRMPHVVEWCKFVTEYSPEKNYYVEGIFDRVYRKQRTAIIGTSRQWWSDLSRFVLMVKYTSSITSDALRMVVNPTYYPKFCVRCGELYIESTNAMELCERCNFTTVQSCSICGNPISFDDDTLEACPGIRQASFVRISGREKPVCKRCMTNTDKIIRCDSCGSLAHRGDSGYGKEILTGVRQGNQLRYCKTCMSSNTVVLCRMCNAYVPTSDLVGTTGLCHECYVDSKLRSKKAEIHGHTFKVPLIFASTTPPVDAPFGLEIEVDDGHHSDALMEYLEGLKEMLRLKSDGSLNDGFEIVTLPATLDFHRNILPYEEMFRRLHADGYTSNDNSTCGLHIHVGRTAFGKTPRSQNPAIGRLIWIFESFKSQISIFSRRKSFTYCNFYGFNPTSTPSAMLNAARRENGRDYRGNRYKAINLQNAGTVEVRIFKGSLKTSTVLASIELCDYAAKYVTKLHKKDEEYTPALTWQKFTSEIKSTEYPNLRNYLQKKRLI